MPQGILGKKIGMTSVFKDGVMVPVTVLEAGPCPVVQVKSEDGADKYTALQLGFIEKKSSRVIKPEAGHFKNAGVKPTRHLREFRGMTGFSQGDEVKAEDVFKAGDIVHARGKSKGRGYSGVMKRHNFHGHKATHGTHESFRGPGSIGACAWPAKVWKGKRMAGQYGNKFITVKNLEVVEILEDNLILVKGAVPGSRNSILELRKDELR